MTPEILQSMPIEQRFRLFVQWLGNQPERGGYRFTSVSNCALCQFGRTLDTTDYLHISAGPHEIHFVSHDCRSLRVEVLPEFGFTKRFALHSNVFGLAYDAFAPAVGLPRRAKWLAAVARLAACHVKHKHQLAA